MPRGGVAGDTARRQACELEAHSIRLRWALRGMHHYWVIGPTVFAVFLSLPTLAALALPHRDGGIAVQGPVLPSGNLCAMTEDAPSSPGTIAMYAFLTIIAFGVWWGLCNLRDHHLRFLILSVSDAAVLRVPPLRRVCMFRERVQERWQDHHDDIEAYWDNLSVDDRGLLISAAVRTAVILLPWCDLNTLHALCPELRAGRLSAEGGLAAFVSALIRRRDQDEEDAVQQLTYAGALNDAKLLSDTEQGPRMVKMSDALHEGMAAAAGAIPMFAGAREGLLWCAADQLLSRYDMLPGTCPFDMLLNGEKKAPLKRVPHSAKKPKRR